MDVANQTFVQGFADDIEWITILLETLAECHTIATESNILVDGPAKNDNCPYHSALFLGCLDTKLFKVFRRIMLNIKTVL